MYVFVVSVVSQSDFGSLVELSRKYPMDTPYLLWYKRLSEDDTAQVSPSPPPLFPADVKKLVDQDNEKFVRERILSGAYRTNPCPDWPPRRDDDDDDRSHSRDDHFGGNVGSRFIF